MEFDSQSSSLSDFDELLRLAKEAAARAAAIHRKRFDEIHR